MAQGVQEDTKTSMKAEELVEILKGEGDRKEKDVAQSGVISVEVGKVASTQSMFGSWLRTVRHGLEWLHFWI